MEKKDINTPDESKFVAQITTDQENAESVRTGDSGLYDIEQAWEDEYLLYKGGGLQWSTSLAYRDKQSRRIRPNSEDNFIFPAIINLHANLTANTPEVTVEGQEESDEEIAEELTYLSRYNDKRNDFKDIWDKSVLQFVSYGPKINMVYWDNDWMGGVGPDRWIGDVRIKNINRKEIFFDPAIIDLEERLQECSFINRKFRKKVQWIKEKWPGKADYISEETNEEDLQNEGADPKQTYLIEYWHRGKPKFVADEYKKGFIEKAESEEDPYKAQEYKDMAEGTLKGIHVAYVANGVFLEYIPYIYDHGKYPIIYRTCYYDENTPHGFGEIRNIKIPQIMHNKADEIEIEAMSREGLGGKLYEEGAVNPRQMNKISEEYAKGGTWIEVDNINKIKDREGVKVPPSVVNYKEHKQNMIETISSNTPIQQGISPGANVPYRTIAELGARTDIKHKKKIEKLESFLIELNELRIELFRQFYAEDRYYRLKTPTGVKEGKFNSNMMYKEWEREEGKPEKYVPEFDINIKISDEKPDDRSYYTSTAFDMVKMQAMTVEDLWETLDKGKFPPKEQILSNLAAQNQIIAMMEKIKDLPEEQKQQFMQQQEQLLQGMQSSDVDAFLDDLSEEVFSQIQQLPQEQQEQAIKELMQQQSTM